MKKPKSDKKPFDFEAFREEAMARFKAGDRIGGPDGIMAPLMQEFIQARLEGEMEAHLEDGPESNRRNGKGKKRVRSEGGMLDLEPPRDRDGTLALRPKFSFVSFTRSATPGSIWPGKRVGLLWLSSSESIKPKTSNRLPSSSINSNSTGVRNTPL